MRTLVKIGRRWYRMPDLKVSIADAIAAKSNVRGNWDRSVTMFGVTGQSRVICNQHR